MSQSMVLSQLFRNRDDWLSSRDIADKMNLAPRNISTALRKLRKHDEVYWKGQIRGRLVYRYKE